ncbi:MAG: hemerythrin domain-containing protein [Myxococcota bacterium]|nr:hemerythrin domain-containing protein [Myxococcota bacterium]
MVEAVRQQAPRAEQEWLDGEHRTLRASGERLEDLLHALAAGDGSLEVEARERIRDYAGQFLAHLEAEERAGVLENAAAAEPRFHRRVEQLRLEHAALRERIGELVAGADASDEGSSWVVFHSSFVVFRESLDAHERDEREVIVNAYMEDLGGRG